VPEGVRQARKVRKAPARQVRHCYSISKSKSFRLVAACTSNTATKPQGCAYLEFTSIRARSWTLPRRRGSLRQAVRAWDRLGLRTAAGRFGDVQRRLRASLPVAREQVYAYVGLEMPPSGEPEWTDAVKIESSESL
jgi:hypothetical protein